MELLTVKEVAQLKDCTVRNIQSLATMGKIEFQEKLNENNRKQYFIPISVLEPNLQAKYYKQKYGEVPAHMQKAREKAPSKKLKSLEEFTADQREQIELWTQILKEWQNFRIDFSGSKSEADAEFVQTCHTKYPETNISKDILYRKQAALRNNDLDGLIDKRGTWKKGTSSAPTDIKDLFMYTYLDERALPIKKCMEATRLILKQERPELLPMIPAYRVQYGQHFPF